MRLIRDIKSRCRKWERKKNLTILTTGDPQKIVHHGEELLIKAFHRSAQRVPAYRDLLLKKGIDYQSVPDIKSFRQMVPVLTKEDIFPKYSIEDLCIDGRLDRMKNPMSSSGFSGVFSFGINTEENLRNAEKSIDTALDYIFNISDRKTFIINCVPMGVKIPTSLPVADTSVRSDMALSIYQKFAEKFDQTIFVSDPHFLKKVVEDGIAFGIDWKKENVHLVSGEDWFPESFRSYLANILGTDWNNPRRGIILATLGIAELDLNLFHESVHSIRIRRAAEESMDLRNDLFGEVEACPILFHYYPHRVFLEAIPESNGFAELVFSMLSQTLLIPLIRYNSKDSGKILTYEQVKAVLEGHGRNDLVPELKLPLVAVGGRKGRSITVNNSEITPEEARNMLYSDFDIARRITGNFLLRNEEGKLMLEIQLREGFTPSDDIHEHCLRLFSKFPETRVRIHRYYDFQHGMSVDYEKKFRHIV